MLKHSLPILATLALTAQASAAGLGGLSIANETDDRRRASSSSVSLVQIAAKGMMFSWKSVTGRAGAANTDAEGKTSHTDQCPDAKTTESDDTDEKKIVSGPEPIYFGF